MKKKLAIVTTHPIQYYAPVFKLLAKNNAVQIKVFYTWGKSAISKFDPGFKRNIEWDVPLLEGYEFEFLNNISKEPGSHHFRGIINPDAKDRISHYDPDAILIYGWSYKSHLDLLRYFKRKCVLFFRGDSNLIDTTLGWKNILKHLLLRWVYSYVDKALYVGTANKQYFKKYGLKDKQLLFAPHAIDNDRFAQDRSSEAEAVREGLGIKENEIVILFAGKLEPKKNPELLLDAFNEVDIADIHLLLVGNGILENGIKGKSSKIKSGKRIHFIDFQNQQNMPVMYQACQLFCLPSKGPGETWGLAVNEAMASGKAVLVSDKVGCAVDLVNDGVNGFIFESENVKDLSDKLRMLVKNRQELLNMGKKSVEIIKRWSFNRQVEAFVEVLNKI